MMNLSRLGLGFSRGRPIAPALALYFTDQLDSRITFTRASEGSYIDSAGVLHWFAAGEPRLGDRGLLIEKGATNSLRNPRCEGAVPGLQGDDGSLPTYWGTPAPGGLDTEIIDSGEEDGISYVDLRIFGTTNATFHVKYFEGATQVASQADQDWVSSAFFKLIAGSLDNISSANIQIRAASAVVTSIPFTPGAEWVRPYATRTMGEADTSVWSGFGLTFPSSGVEVDITLRVGLPQLEMGKYPTSPIRPPQGAPAATARAADVASIDLTSADWFNPVEGTMVAEFALGTTVAIHTIWQMDDGSNENRVLNRTQGTGSNLLYAFAVAENSQSAGINLGAVSPGNVYRAAYSFAEDDFRASLGGAAVGSDTSGDMPEMTRLLLGKEHVGSFLDGHIRSLVYYPRALEDAQLRSLSA